MTAFDCGRHQGSVRKDCPECRFDEVHGFYCLVTWLTDPARTARWIGWRAVMACLPMMRPWPSVAEQLGMDTA